MKEEALRLARAMDDPTAQLNVLREYLQAEVLRSLHESEAFRCLSFVGGTALRFLFDLPRFSEDLDFSLEDTSGYRPEVWLGKLKRDLAFAGWDATLTWNDRKTVHSGWIRWSDVLHELRLAAHPDQKLSVKIEVDTRPPAGAVLENRIVNRRFLVALRHHDVASLMTGKIHAIWARPYPKGRDWYDLIWYLARRPSVEPNLKLLEAALAQTGHETPSPALWRTVLAERAASLDWGRIAADVGPFLEHAGDLSLLTAEHIIRELRA